jgi:transcriptional regulator with XRE-family HTH domain
MTSTPQKYGNQRARKTPPHIAIGDLRAALGLTLEQVAAAMTESTGHKYTKGALSAIESGTRGVSADTLHALHVAYGLRPNSIRLDYDPEARKIGVAS